MESAGVQDIGLVLNFKYPVNPVESFIHNCWFVTKSPEIQLTKAWRSCWMTISSPEFLRLFVSGLTKSPRNSGLEIGWMIKQKKLQPREKRDPGNKVEEANEISFVTHHPTWQR